MKRFGLSLWMASMGLSCAHQGSVVTPPANSAEATGNDAHASAEPPDHDVVAAPPSHPDHGTQSAQSSTSPANVASRPTADEATGLDDTPGPASPSPDRPVRNNKPHYDRGDIAPAAPPSPIAERRAGVDGSARRELAPAPQSALKAGRHDDNKEYSRFLDFLAAHRALAVLPVDVSERLVLRAVDSQNRSLANCRVEVQTSSGALLATATTYADGQTQFFPAAMGQTSDKDYTFAVRCGSEHHTLQATRRGRRQVEARFATPRHVPARMPLDVAIVLDTTGSMQAQIDRLKSTLAAIHFQISQLPSQPDVRFALVAYRDRGDEYVTQVTPLTADVAAFQQVLNTLQADGGGDTPEDMQAGLEQALHTLHWREDAIRIGFLVADAPPHIDYGEAFDYRAAMQESLRRGIKWVGVAVGGAAVDTEVIFRQIAQYTLGEYVFVTESDGGDTEGSASQASHHVGSNYHAENLDQAIVRIVRRELSYVGDDPRDFDDTIHVSTQAHGAPSEWMSEAMADAIRQLNDYSALPLDKRTPTAVLPVQVSDKRLKDTASRLGDELTLAASRHPSFQVVERDLSAIAAELKVQLSDLADDTQAVPIGKLTGARVLVITRMVVHGDNTELFARLVRVETGEVLSVAKVALANTH